MTNEQILKKAIKKAWENGYMGCKRVKEWHYLAERGKLESIIFSHDFAKAFWDAPENIKYYKNNEDRTPVYEWQFHLKIMVLEEDPIKYLEQFIHKQ